MPNFTLNIKNCKAFILRGNNERSTASGYLIWTDGTIEFKKNFRTFSQTVVAFIEANKEPEKQFEINGGLTKSEGKKEWAGKFFEEIIISDIKLST